MMTNATTTTDDAVDLALHEHRALLLRVARGLLGSDAQAEDCLQSAAILARASSQDGGALAPLSCCLVDEALCWARANHARQRGDALGDALRDFLARRVDDWPGPLRAAFVLAWLELPAEQIALLLGISTAAARMQCRRACALLREAIACRVDPALDDALGSPA